MSERAVARRIAEARTQGDALRDPHAIIGRRIGQEALAKLAELNLRFLKGVPNGWCVVVKDCDLSGLDLRNLNFSHAHFIACSFENANLEDARFVSTNLFSAKFDNANLTRTDFAHADLRGACFENAELNGARLKGADLRRGVVLRDNQKLRTQRENSTFRNARLHGTILSECKLLGADFEGAALSGVSMQGADLRGANFAGAELSSVELSGANLTDTDFRRAIMDEQTAGRGDMMRAAKARRAPGADRLKRILDAHLLWIQTGQREGEQADFSFMDLSRLNFSGAILASGQFRGAILADTCFERAVLAAADFRDAIMIRANLTRADLRGADLRGANLRDAEREGLRMGALAGTTLATRT